MRRREFLKGVAAVAGGTVLARAGRGQDRADGAGGIRVVHVVFKTHLDVGFTDMAANVLRRYDEEFIPRAMALAERTRVEGEGKDRFVWTVGAWLVWRYLERAGAEQRRRMERAIAAGDLVWHALPFTTHTEAVDPGLMRVGLAYARVLDKRFGRKIVAGKMTDVPGHTRAVVPIWAEAGVRFVHIGVNWVSTGPKVPGTFVWRDEASGSEVVMMYHQDYGGVTELPEAGAAVAICFTGDNHGPQSPEEVGKIYADLRQRFPGARVTGSTFEAVAGELERVRSRLPVVTGEIGDTWIHGIGSDPKLMAEYRELCRARAEWVKGGKMEACGEVDLRFGGELLLVPEHTWGMDVKGYLKDWDVQEPGALAEARRTRENFRRVEASWAEKRAHVGAAIEALPRELAEEARRRVEGLRAVRPVTDGLAPLTASGAEVEGRHFVLALDMGAGGLRRLRGKRTGREWAAGPEHLLGRVGYQTFSAADCERYLGQYLRVRNEWAVGDFGKVGIERTTAVSRTWWAGVRRAWGGTDAATGDVRVVAEMGFDESAAAGAPVAWPGEVWVEWVMPAGDEAVVRAEVQWFGKPANRLPEAVWWSWRPAGAARAAGWEVEKMGRWVSPLDVVENGGSQMHAVGGGGVRYRDGRGALQVGTSDAALVAVGERRLLDFTGGRPVDTTGGVHFNLFNNVWGTNFRMWFDEDVRFRFAIRA